MAPLTRRRKAAQDSSQESPAPTPKSSASKPKRRPVTDEVEDSTNELEMAKVTPKRSRLAVRTRDEKTSSAEGRSAAGDKAQPVIKTKRSREALIADSEDSDDGEPTPHQVAKQLEDDANQHLSQELKAEHITYKSTPTTAAAAKGKRIVFGDDNDVEQYVAAVTQKAEKARPTAAEEIEDSDDEAPEAVSASAAAEESKKAAQAVIDAAEKQAANLKRKRQERDSTFKQQAQKRKRAEKPKSKAIEGATGSDDESGEEDVAEIEKTTTGRKRAEKLSLPNLLPAEFLTESEDESEDERDLRVAKPKKIKFDDAILALSKEGKAPRDEIVGTTAYRVMVDQADQKLPPKANHNSKSVKDMLLRRRRVGVAPTKAQGFFKRR